MNGSFRQSMTWLHTWAGLILCWIMYFMFITGTLGYFDTEIDRWMKPELQNRASLPLERNIDIAVERLEIQAANATLWRIFPPTDRQTPHLRVSWEVPSEEGQRPQRTTQTIDTNTGEPFAESQRATGGGQTLYRMHYILHYIPRDLAYRFIGIVTLIMFVGIVTGIIIHRKIFLEFFTFRPNKGLRSWLDMHNLMSVASLPFQVMITYSGLIFMITTWMPLITLGSYGFDTDKAREAITRSRGGFSIEAAGVSAPLTPIQKTVEQAIAHWGSETMRFIEVHHPGDANARVVVYKQTTISSASEGLVFDGVSGDLLAVKPLHNTSALAVAQVFIGLHEGLFAGPALRWLYFFSGLIGAAMVATGAIYWVAKRKFRANTRSAAHSYRMVEKLNIGTITGLLIAIGVYFLANRLLPLGFEGREHWEVHCLFIAWGLCFLHAWVRPPLQAWCEQCWAGAMVFISIPFVNAITTNTHVFSYAAQADWVLVSFDISCLCAGIIFALVAQYLKLRVQSQWEKQPVTTATVS